jgi:hypothetical protein
MSRQDAERLLAHLSSKVEEKGWRWVDGMVGEVDGFSNLCVQGWIDAAGVYFPVNFAVMGPFGSWVDDAMKSIEIERQIKAKRSA